jgi:hypothetical protein
MQMLIRCSMSSDRRDIVAELIAHETATRVLLPLQHTGYAPAFLIQPPTTLTLPSPPSAGGEGLLPRVSTEDCSSPRILAWFLCHRRLRLGFGRGLARREFAAFRGTMDASRDRFDEAEPPRLARQAEILRPNLIVANVLAVVGEDHHRPDILDTLRRIIRLKLSSIGLVTPVSARSVRHHLP